MSDSAVVTFRLLSGNNIGAVFTLPQGRYTLGNSDSCDIQIDESGEITVVGLSITPDLAVSVVLLKGKARLDGEKLELEQALPFASAKVLAIGFSAITHLDEGEEPFTIDLSLLGLAHKQEFTAEANTLDNITENTNVVAVSNDATVVAPSSMAVAAQIEGASAVNTQLHGELKEVAAVNGTIAEARMKSRWHISKLLLFIVGLILLGLALSSLIAGSTLFGARAKQRNALQTANNYIADQGFKHVTFDFDDRVITFKGHVESQEEFNRLVNNLPPLPYATVLALNIKDSFLSNVEQACAVRGASVSASYLPQLSNSKSSSDHSAVGLKGESQIIDEAGNGNSNNSDHGSDSDFIYNQSKIAIRGYVQDQLVEASLLRNVSDDLQCDNLVGAFTLKPQLEAIIARFLPMELYDVPLLLDRFKVYYDGELTLTQMQLLSVLQEQVSKEVRAEVMFEPLKNRGRSMIEQVAHNSDKLKRMSLLSQTSAPLVSSVKEDPPQDSLAEQAQSEPLDFDEISGVTMTPLRFVSMKDGSKYFEGAVMSNGAVLKNISVHALSFELNGELMIHELK